MYAGRNNGLVERGRREHVCLRRPAEREAEESIERWNQREPGKAGRR